MFYLLRPCMVIKTAQDPPRDIMCTMQIVVCVSRWFWIERDDVARAARTIGRPASPLFGSFRIFVCNRYNFRVCILC